MRPELTRRWRNLGFATVLILILGAVCLGMGFMRYHRAVYNQALDDSLSRISERSEQLAEEVTVELNHGAAVLTNISALLNSGAELSSGQLASYLQKTAAAENFSSIAVMEFGVNAPADVIVTESYKDLVTAIKNGETYLSDVENNAESGAAELLIAAPYYKGNELVGAVWGRYDIAALMGELNLSETSFRYFHIIDGDGDYIIHSNNQYAISSKPNYWQDLESFTITTKGLTADTVREQVNNGQVVSLWYADGDKSRYVTLEPLGLNNWYMVSSLAAEGLQSYVNEIDTGAGAMRFWIVMYTILVAGGISVGYYLIYRSVRGKNRELLTKDEALSLIQKRRGSMIFIYDVQDKKAILYGKDIPDAMRNQWQKAEALDADAMATAQRIHPEDIDTLRELCNTVRAGRAHTPVELELHLNDAWEWKRISTWVTPTGDVVGYIEDFGLQRDFRTKARHDALTGLYNRIGFQRHAEPLLQEITPADTKLTALFYLDLDHFKDINDTFGHAKGDDALRAAADAMHSALRKEDLICRFGGDEFAVLVPDIPDRAALETIADKLIRALEATYTEGSKTVHLSASLGAAIAKPNQTLDELCAIADKALYEVKKTGRNGFKIADDTTVEA